MSIVNGQIANQSTFNSGFMSRTAATTQTVAQIALENPETESGANIENVQRAINKVFEGVGATGEADTTINEYANENYISSGDSRKVAVEKLDAQLFQTQADLDAAELTIINHENRIDAAELTIADHESRIDAAELTIADHENRIDSLETGTMTIGGDKTFSGNIVVQGDFEVQGTLTSINSTNLEVTDQNILTNKNGTNASAEGAGLEVERPLGNAALHFDSSLASKWKIGIVSSLYEVVVSGIAQTISGIKDFVSGIKTDVINESTSNAGVTIDAVLIKDGNVDGRDISADGIVQDSHIADTNIHFTESSIDHNNIQNKGSNTHTQIDNHIANTSNPHEVTKSQVGLSDVTNDAQLKRAAGDINSFTEKTTPTGNDVLLIEDSADSFNKKKVKISNLGAGSGGGLPIGSLVDSTLTLSQFQTLMGTGWVLANGAGILGSSLHALTGQTTALDARGIVRRGKDHGRGTNPDGDTAIGTYQGDSIQSHSHGINTWFSEVGIGPNQPNIQGYGGTGPFPAGSTTGMNSGTESSETRMRNVTVNVFLRIN